MSTQNLLSTTQLWGMAVLIQRAGGEVSISDDELAALEPSTIIQTDYDVSTRTTRIKIIRKRNSHG